MLLQKRKVVFSIYHKNCFVRQMKRTQSVVRVNKDRYLTMHPLTGKSIPVAHDTSGKKAFFWTTLFCN